MYSSSKRGFAARRQSHSGGITTVQAPDCQSKTFLSGDQKGDTLFLEREYPPLPAFPASGGKPTSQHGKALFENELFQLTRIIGDHRSRRLRSQLRLERKPQLTAMTSSPAFSPVCTSTSESPTNTASFFCNSQRFQRRPPPCRGTACSARRRSGRRHKSIRSPKYSRLNFCTAAVRLVRHDRQLDALCLQLAQHVQKSVVHPCFDLAVVLIVRAVRRQAPP